MWKTVKRSTVHENKSKNVDITCFVMLFCLVCHIIPHIKYRIDLHNDINKQVSIVATLANKFFINKDAIEYFGNFPKVLITENRTVVQKYRFIPKIAEYSDIKECLHNNMNDLVRSNSFYADQNYYHIKNVYFLQTDIVCTGNGKCYMFDGWGLQFFDIHIKNEEKHVVALSQFFSGGYGDFMNTVIYRLVQFPIEILKKSVIPVFCNFRIMDEVLDALEVSRSAVKLFDKFDLIFCRNLYTIQPLWQDFDYNHELHHGCYGELGNKYADLMIEKFAKGVKPTKFGLMNRDKGMVRYIGNFDAIVETVNKKYPKIMFDIIPHIHKTLSEAVRAAASYRWVFCSCGSNVMNLVYMQKGTCVCMFMLNFYDYPSISVLTQRGVFSVSFEVKGSHIGTEPIIIDPFYCEKFIKRSFEILEKQSL